MNCLWKLFSKFKFKKRIFEKSFNVLYRCRLRRRLTSKLSRRAAILLIGRIDCINSIDFLSLREVNIIIDTSLSSFTGLVHLQPSIMCSPRWFFSNTVTWFLYYHPLASRNHFEISINDRTYFHCQQTFSLPRTRSAKWHETISLVSFILFAKRQQNCLHYQWSVNEIFIRSGINDMNFVFNVIHIESEPFNYGELFYIIWSHASSK